MAASQESEFAKRLTALLPQAIAWAAGQSQLVLQMGEPLNGAGLKVARAVGVERPEHIRIWTVPQLPVPADPELKRFAQEQNLIGPDTRAFTLGYGILIRRGEMDIALLSHECRHVYQVEKVGSLDTFLPLYLKQIADFTYARAPYEEDARRHELTVCP